MNKQTMQATWYDRQAVHKAQDSGQMFGKAIVEIA